MTEKQSLYFSIHPTGGMFNSNCILLGDKQSGEYVLIDCGNDISHVVETAKKNGLTKCTEIICTHGHIDHIAGLQQAVELTKAPVSIHSQDMQLYNIGPLQGMIFGYKINQLPQITRQLEEYDRIYVGNFEGVVYHTPGHSPGSICIHFEEENIMVTGDTIFSGNVGNSMLPGGDPVKLKESVLRMLNEIPSETVIIPGHGELTTVLIEKRSNIINYM